MFVTNLRYIFLLHDFLEGYTTKTGNKVVSTKFVTGKPFKVGKRGLDCACECIAGILTLTGLCFCKNEVELGLAHNLDWAWCINPSRIRVACRDLSTFLVAWSKVYAIRTVNVETWVVGGSHQVDNSCRATGVETAPYVGAPWVVASDTVERSDVHACEAIVDGRLCSCLYLRQDTWVTVKSVEQITGLQCVGRCKPLLVVVAKEDILVFCRSKTGTFCKVRDRRIENREDMFVNFLLFVERWLKNFISLASLWAWDITVKVGKHTKVYGFEHLGHTEDVEFSVVRWTFGCAFVNDSLNVHQVTICAVPLIIISRRSHNLNRVAKLCFHQLVVTRTEFLFGKRRNIPGICTRGGGVTGRHDSVGNHEFCPNFINSRITVILVYFIHCIFRARYGQKCDKGHQKYFFHNLIFSVLKVRQ